MDLPAGVKRIPMRCFVSPDRGGAAHDRPKDALAGLMDLIANDAPIEAVLGRRLALRVTGKIANPHTASWLHDELCMIIGVHDADPADALHRFEFFYPMLAGMIDDDNESYGRGADLEAEDGHNAWRFCTTRAFGGDI